jgi:hypothetical protein
MNIETVFSIWVIWFLYNYEPTYNMLIQLYELLEDYCVTFNDFVHPHYGGFDYDSDDEINEAIITDDEKDLREKENKVTVRYEDKYLELVRNMKNEWNLSQEELECKSTLTNELFEQFKTNAKKRMDDINIEINEINNEILEDTDIIHYVDNYDNYDFEAHDSKTISKTLEDRTLERNAEIKELSEEEEELKKQLETEEGLGEVMNTIENKAFDIIVKKHTDKLKNSFVIEKTPQGNVLMVYDNEKETFKYYCDSTIPYKYLEVVCRKYVKTLNCRPLYIDMEEELKIVDEKWTKEYELKKAKELEEKIKKEQDIKNNIYVKPKKNVFAKLKNYNTNTGIDISKAPAPKNSIVKNNTSKEQEKILLKERANRYTHEGKLSNFNFLQNVNKSIFNKKLGMTFADFKKIT